METCNHDCFNCPFPDCICEEGATLTEIRDADRRDKLLTQPEAVDTKRRYQARSKTTLTPAQKERARQKSAEYRETHREEINRKQRERYATDPAFRAKVKQNTANYWRNVRKDYLRAKRRERDERNRLQGQS